VNLLMKEATMTMEMFGTSPAVLDSTPTPRKHHGRRALTLGVAASAAIALFIGGVGATASADSTGSSNAIVTVASEITLVTPLSFTLAGTGVLSGSHALATPVGFAVTTNNPTGYKVTVHSTPTVMAGTGLNTDTIPVANLGVKPILLGTANAGFTSVPTGVATALTVFTKGTESSDPSDTLAIDYSLLVPVVHPDTYTVALDYVATTLGG